MHDLTFPLVCGLIHDLKNEILKVFKIPLPFAVNVLILCFELVISCFFFKVKFWNELGILLNRP